MNFDTLISNFDKELSKFHILKEFEKKTKVPKTWSTASVAGFLIFLVFMNVGGKLITNLFGFVYPAYASFKAIESGDKEDDVQWLMYWTTFGFMNLIELFSDVVIYWIP